MIKIKTLGAFLCAGLIALLSSGSVAASETLGFGLTAGKVGGMGFSVRKLPAQGYGWQAGGIYLQDSDDTYFNIGGMGLYVLNRTTYTSLYLAGGLGYTMERWTEYEYGPPPVYEEKKVRKTERGFAAGAGIGVALRFARWEQMWFSAELLLTAYHKNVLPLPQAGVHYLFR